jgi:carbonic anhydrase
MLYRASLALHTQQEVPELSTREVLIIHHTDCGAQAAMRHHDHLVARMKELLAAWNIAGWALQVLVLVWLWQ